MINHQDRKPPLSANDSKSNPVQYCQSLSPGMWQQQRQWQQQQQPLLPVSLCATTFPYPSNGYAPTIYAYHPASHSHQDSWMFAQQPFPQTYLLAQQDLYQPICQALLPFHHDSAGVFAQPGLRNYKPATVSEYSNPDLEEFMAKAKREGAEKRKKIEERRGANKPSTRKTHEKNDLLGPSAIVVAPTETEIDFATADSKSIASFLGVYSWDHMFTLTFDMLYNILYAMRYKSSYNKNPVFVVNVRKYKDLGVLDKSFSEQLIYCRRVKSTAPVMRGLLGVYFDLIPETKHNQQFSGKGKFPWSPQTTTSH